jgi:uncharacterized protein YdeI (BOF family)
MMMYKMCITRWLSLAATAALLVACDGPPSGPVVSEQRAVGDFHAVELRGSGKLQIQSGAATQVTLASTRERLDNTKVEVVDGTLIIRNEQSGSAWEDNALNITIHTPKLDGVEVNGAGDINITGLDQAVLKLVVRGAGKLAAQGKATQLDATIEGAGAADLYPLATETAKVVVDGAGSIDLNVSKALSATVSGVGKIRYRGNPASVEKAVHGIGSVEAASGP